MGNLHSRAPVSFGDSSVADIIMIPIFIAAVIGWAILKLILNFTYWSRHGVPNRPYPKFSWLYKPFDEFLIEQELNDGSKLAGGFMFYKKFLLINDPYIARDLSVKEMHKYQQRFDTQIGDNTLAKSLFFLDAGANWKRIRSIVSPTFTSGKLKAMMEPITEITDQLIENLRPQAKKGEVFDIKRFIDGFTLDVIARCAYGIRLNSIEDPDSPVIVNAKKILNINVNFTQALCVLLPSLAKLLKLNFFDVGAIGYFDQLTKTIIEKRRQSKQNNYNDLIGLMMKEYNKGQDGISLEEISAQSILFFVAGFDTTNAAFDNLLAYLGAHPEWQEKLYEELKGVNLEYDKLGEYPILNAVINETLRLKPSLMIIERVATEDGYLLDTGIPIEKGTTLSIQPYIIHRDPDYFEDPNEFKPERFIGTGLENDVAYMPFGVGPRFCVGMRFAMNELRIGVAKFFQNYSVELPKNFDLKYYNGSILLSPKDVNLILHARP